MERNMEYGNLQLNDHQVQVFYFGLGGARLSEGSMFNHHDLQDALNCQPHVVYIHIGCNDLKITSAENITDRLIDLTVYISSKPGIRIVCVSQLFPFPSTVDCLDSIKKINESLRTKFSNSCNVFYWRHRGFWNPEKNIFLSDQTHLDFEGQKRYWASVRYAMKSACSSLSIELL
jgi:hypothetical protein